jgi:acyl-CoA thioester hydrolase
VAVTRHITEVPMRWSDLDAYQHVNNVVFLRYLQEARVDMLFVHAPAHGAEALAEGIVIARHEIEYLAPLSLRPEPARVETWVTKVSRASFSLGYEVVDVRPDGTRIPYVRAASVLVPYDLANERPRQVRQEERAVLERYLEPDGPTVRPAQPPIPPASGVPGKRHIYLARVRWEDLDAFRHVNNVVFVEYFQEARVDLAIKSGIGRLTPHEGTVVGRQEIDYRRPVPLRTKPLEIDTWVTRIGNSSYGVAYEVRDGETVCATGSSTQIAFDLTTGKTRRLLDRERALLEEYHG